MNRIPMLFLWTGAAISISEVYTGGLLAPLGFAKAALAIVLGHLIGSTLLAAGGYVSWRKKQNAMECAASCFGGAGGKLIALCNTIQLVGWTIVMVVQAASAIAAVFPALGITALVIALAVLVLLWALIFGSPAAHLNELVVAALALLCLALFAEARGGGGAMRTFGFDASTMPFSLALELSIAMPVSWLPLIGDYSVKARDKTAASLMPFIGYGTASTLMYLFGLYLAVTSGGDIFAFLAGSRFRIAACAVVVLSTLTTAFLDLYSAAVSSEQLTGRQQRFGGRGRLLALGLLCLVLAAFFPVERYGDLLSSFLTAIGSVFVPVYAVLFIDYLKKRRSRHLVNICVASCGVIFYHLALHFALPSPTLLCIAFVVLVCGAALCIDNLFFYQQEKTV